MNSSNVNDVNDVLRIYDSGTANATAVFHCPGCRYDHPFDLTRWTWNGDMRKPTFTPSLLVFKDIPEYRCHSFVTNGQIQFLDDCHHELRGKTVNMVSWDDEDFDTFYNPGSTLGS